MVCTAQVDSVHVTVDGVRRTVVVDDPSMAIIVAADGAAALARRLLDRCGGNAEAAHGAITKAARQSRRRGRGKPPASDDGKFAVALAIKRRDGISDSRAINEAARVFARDDEVESVARRMRDKKAGMTLEEYVQALPLAGDPEENIRLSEAIATGAIALDRVAEMIAAMEVIRDLEGLGG